MISKQVWQKGLTFVAGGVTALTLAAPKTAYAGIFDIFGVINSTITGAIGGPLKSMTLIASSLQSDMQTVLVPVAKINQSLNFVNSTVNSYRGWMSTVFTMQTGSGQLSATQLAELEWMSGLQGTITDMQGKVGQINAAFAKVNGAIPSVSAAPLVHRLMMDMTDTISKNALSESVIGDQSAAKFVTMANGIENQTAASAPGTAPMLASSAKAAELSSLAGQHKLLAAMLREEAAELASETAAVKMAVAHTQELNQTVSGAVGSR